MDNKHRNFAWILTLLIFSAAVVTGCSDSGGEGSGAGGGRPLKQYRIIGDSGIFRVEVQKGSDPWRTLAVKLSSRKECREVIEQNFSRSGDEDRPAK